MKFRPAQPQEGPGRRPPHGGRGLKFTLAWQGRGRQRSSPARGTWIEIQFARHQAPYCASGRPPHGGRGLKCPWHGLLPGGGGRPPHGGRGLKLPECLLRPDQRLSSPARGTWIEIVRPRSAPEPPRSSSPARGTWIEISCAMCCRAWSRSSPARGTWIEITMLRQALPRPPVVPRTGDVD